MAEIVLLPTDHNDQVLEEIDAHEKARVEQYERLENSPRLSHYISRFQGGTAGLEFSKRFEVERGMKVLEVGFGRGESALYLSDQRARVHALDPSPLHCQLLESAAEKFDLPVKIYQGVGEDLDRIDEGQFDRCFFHRSLHHCDDPLRVLTLCRQKLKKNGRVIAINEPHLKIYRSKEWFFNRIHQDPAHGHYGGNEHIYYQHEYMRLFRDAGFRHVTCALNERYQHPRVVLLENLQRRTGEAYVYSDGVLVYKFVKQSLMKWLIAGPLLAAGKRLSLFDFSYIAS